jgi:UDP-N-acetylglucosamine acyltransferase
MAHSHVDHDCVLEDGVTLSSHVALGGHTRILRRANLGMGTVAHQFSTIGAYVMTGMGSVITHDIPPFCLVFGNPARYRRFNTHSFKSIGLDETDLAVENGRIASTHPLVAAELARFFAEQRRTVLPLGVVG